MYGSTNVLYSMHVREVGNKCRTLAMIPMLFEILLATMLTCLFQLRSDDNYVNMFIPTEVNYVNMFIPTEVRNLWTTCI